MKKQMKREFDKFVKIMEKRLNYGQKKYGDGFMNKNLPNELLDEATDLSNYAFLLYLKAKEFNKKWE